MRVLHVEVGGSYGGSLRALELYLANTDLPKATHEVLLYYPTPGSEKLASKATRLWTLYGSVPSRLTGRPIAKSNPWLASVLRRTFPTSVLSEVLSWGSLVRDLPTALRIFRLLRSGGYDVIHVNNSFTYQVPTILAARVAGIPVVAHARNPQQHGPFGRTIMQLTDYVVSDSRFHENELRSWGLRVSLATCYNGVELPEVDEAYSQQLRTSLLCGGKVLIGSVGRLDKQKGYEDLIGAARRVVEAFPKVSFAIAGEGPLRPTLEKLIADRNLQGRFHLCGFRPDVANFLGALDVFVCSSHWEGLPLAVVEAMLSGKPVVVTDVSGNSEVVAHERTGTLVPAGNPEALAAALISTLDNRDQALRQAGEARRLAAGMFDPRSTARQFDGILRTVLTRKESKVRDFYERSYSTSAWSRATQEADSAPRSRFTKMWYRALIEHILPELRLQGMQALEVGAGYGYLAAYLCQRGVEYLGVDIAHSALRQFPKIAGCKCHPVLADGRLLPFAEASFDLLICMEVLEHLPDPNPLVDECFRVVRPGGKLIFSCPNYFNMFWGVKLFADLGLPFFRRYLNHQAIDRTTTSFELRRLLARRAAIQTQRAVRLHPPFFEQLDYRLSPGAALRRINDWIFHVEKTWGDRVPFSYLGFHTLCLVEKN